MKTNLFSDIPCLKIYVFFAIGILLKSYFSTLTIDLNLLSFGIILFLLAAYKIKLNLLFWVGIIGLGFCLHQYQNDYFKHRIKHNAIQGKIVEPPIEKKKSIEVLLELQYYINQDFKIEEDGKLARIYLPKCDEVRALKYGDQLVINSRIDTFVRPLNPFEFDYKLHMERKNIYYRSYATLNQITILRNNHLIPLKMLFSIRKKMIEIIESAIQKKEERDIAKSLILGDQTAISQEVLDAYSNTGTIHILSVSGLHVGVFVWLLGFLFSGKLGKNKFLRFTTIVSFVWLYGLISGLSAPVLRCAVMFTLFELARWLNRTKSIINIVAFSALFILIFHTNSLFDLGYQLSFSAMTGIILLYPKIYSKLVFENSIYNKIWELISGTIAAWIFTFPLIAYNFHKIALLGNFANLIAIPISTLVLYLGLILMLVSPIFSLKLFLGYTIQQLIVFQNFIISYFDTIEWSSVQGVYWSTAQFICWYSIMGLIVFFLIHKKWIYFLNALLAVVILCLMNLIGNTKESNDEFIVFNLPKSSIVAIKIHRDCYLLGDTIRNRFDWNKIESYIMANHIQNTILIHRKKVTFKKNTILLVNRKIATQDTFDYAVLSKEALDNDIDFLNDIRAKKWIIDGTLNLKKRKAVEKIFIEKKYSFISLDPTTFAYIQKLP